MIENWSDYFIAEGVVSELNLNPLPVFDVDGFQVDKTRIAEFNNFMLLTRFHFDKLLETNQQTQFFTDTSSLELLDFKLTNMESVYTLSLASLIGESNEFAQKYLSLRLDINNAEQTLIGLNESIEQVAELVIASQHNQAADSTDNINDVVLEDLISLGKKVGFSDTYNRLINDKIRLEENISALQNSRNNLSNFNASLLNLQEQKLTRTKSHNSNKPLSNLLQLLKTYPKKFKHTFSSLPIQTLKRCILKITRLTGLKPTFL